METVAIDKEGYDRGYGFGKMVAIHTYIPPTMSREFDPCAGCPTQEIYEIDLLEGTIVELSYEDAKALYKNVVGRQDRISYWHALRHLKDGCTDCERMR